MRDKFFSDAGADKAITEDLDSQQGRMSRDEAYKVLARVNEEFRGNTFDIPGEEYDNFSKAAGDYLFAVKRLEQLDPNARKKDKIAKIAQRILDEAPEKVLAA